MFISFAERDAILAADLEAALRRHNIQAWSSLDVPSGEDWKRLLDTESANADGFLFLLGAGFSNNPQLHVFSVAAHGLFPRSARETEGDGQPRFSRILSTIAASKYSIHDLSR